MNNVWEKIKSAWPYIWAVLKLLPVWLLKTRTGQVILTMLLLKLGLNVDEQTIKEILALIAAALSIDPQSATAVVSTLQEYKVPEIVNDVAVPVLGIYGTMFANESKQFLKDQIGARLHPQLPPAQD